MLFLTPQIRMCSRNDCVAYSFKKPWDSTRQLFSSGFQRTADLDQAELLAVFDPYLGDYRVKIETLFKF